MSLITQLNYLVLDSILTALQSVSNTTYRSMDAFNNINKLYNYRVA
jgi:hypothetical protein